MPRTTLILFALLTAGVTAPLRVRSNTRPIPPAPRVAPATVVARVMSFDHNRDGVVSREELPERMQGVLTRVNFSTVRGGVNAAAIRRLAEHPMPTTAGASGIQAGQYGFGDDTGLDTRRHLEGAIEDLRLARANRDEAMRIGRAFVDRREATARRDLVSAITPLLSLKQLARVIDVLESKPRDRAAGLAPGLGEAQRHVLEMLIARSERNVRQRTLVMLVKSFGLEPSRRQQVLSALGRFNAPARLNDADRAALVAGMRRVLTPQQIDDLRAALQRRPLVKQVLFAASLPGSGNLPPLPFATQHPIPQ